MFPTHSLRTLALSTALSSAIGAACLLSSPMAAAKGDAAAGKDKAASCAACHGADGNSVNPMWPRLAGQWPDYLVKALEDYQSGQRQNAIMAGFAAPLSEQDREDLAAYYSEQEAKIYTVEP